VSKALSQSFSLYKGKVLFLYSIFLRLVAINKELKGFNAAMVSVHKSEASPGYLTQILFDLTYYTLNGFAFQVNLIKSVIFDTLFSGEGRDMARFYALETIARMPYFSYLFVLHFYETLGWWRQAGYLKIHFAESWNEHHHLLIMEELGGSERWADRFVAQHVAIGYFWMVVGMYFANPTLAYNLNQNVEEHAFATYDSFLKSNKEELKKRPAPRAAINYYRNGDLYMMDAFQTNCAEQKRRRPEIENLYDVFVAIRDDEMEHVKTMAGLQEGMALQSISDDDTCEVPPDVVITAKVTP